MMNIYPQKQKHKYSETQVHFNEHTTFKTSACYQEIGILRFTKTVNNAKLNNSDMNTYSFKGVLIVYNQCKLSFMYTGKIKKT